MDDLFGALGQMEGRQRLSRAKKTDAPKKAQPTAEDLEKRKELMQKAREAALAEAKKAAESKK